MELPGNVVIMSATLDETMRCTLIISSGVSVDMESGCWCMRSRRTRKILFDLEMQTFVPCNLFAELIKRWSICLPSLLSLWAQPTLFSPQTEPQESSLHLFIKSSTARDYLLSTVYGSNSHFTPTCRDGMYCTSQVRRRGVSAFTCL